MAKTVSVSGLEEFIHAALLADKATSGIVRQKLREAGDVVRDDASRRYRDVDLRSARGLEVRARPTGVFVEQKLRKTTGLHPEWGSWQMRHALIPAQKAKEEEVVQRIERAVDELITILER